MNKKKLLALLVSSAFLFAACGDDDSPSSPKNNQEEVSSSSEEDDCDSDECDEKSSSSKSNDKKSSDSKDNDKSSSSKKGDDKSSSADEPKGARAAKLADLEKNVQLNLFDQTVYLSTGSKQGLVALRIPDEMWLVTYTDFANGEVKFTDDNVGKQYAETDAVVHCR